MSALLGYEYTESRGALRTREVSRSPYEQLQMVVSSQEDTGNHTRVHCKSVQCSQSLSHLCHSTHP